MASTLGNQSRIEPAAGFWGMRRAHWHSPIQHSEPLSGLFFYPVLNRPTLPDLENGPLPYCLFASATIVVAETPLKPTPCFLSSQSLVKP